MCTVFGTKIDYFFDTNTANSLIVSLVFTFYLFSNTSELNSKELDILLFLILSCIGPFF